MSSNSSAYFGQPPQTPFDWKFVTYQIAAYVNPSIPAGKPHPDPADGVPGIPKPPAGYNFQNRDDNPGNLFRQAEGVQAACIFLIVLVTAARLSVRLMSKRLRFGWDDYAIIPGAAAGIASIVLGMVSTVSGRDIWSVTYAEYWNSHHFWLPSILCFFTASAFVKLSIALFIRRIIGAPTSGQFRFWARAVECYAWLLGAYWLATMLSTIFLCGDPKQFFVMNSPKDNKPFCVNAAIQIGAMAAIHVALDIVMLIPPVFIFWKMNVKLVYKVKLLTLFSTGLLSTVCSVLRLVAQKQVNDAPYPDTRGWAITNIWSAVDATAAICVACLPAINFFFTCTCLHRNKATPSSRAEHWNPLFWIDDARAPVQDGPG